MNNCNIWIGNLFVYVIDVHNLVLDTGILYKYDSKHIKDLLELFIMLLLNIIPIWPFFVYTNCKRP